MQGYNTFMASGTDHASISTEMKVVQKIKNEGKTKYDLGREKFFRRSMGLDYICMEELFKNNKEN